MARGKVGLRVLRKRTKTETDETSAKKRKCSLSNKKEIMQAEGILLTSKTPNKNNDNKTDSIKKSSYRSQIKYKSKNLKKELKNAKEETVAPNDLTDEEEIGQEDDPFKHYENILTEDAVKLCEQQRWQVNIIQRENLGTLHLFQNCEPSLENVTIENKINTKKTSVSNIKPKLLANLINANKIALKESEYKYNMTPFQEEVLRLMKEYVDILYTERTCLNAEEIRLVYSIHVLNHILKTRSKIIRHNSKFSNEEFPDEYRDHGLTRPKVLILVPFKESVIRIVKMFIDLLSFIDNLNVINKKRFLKEFGSCNKPVMKARKRPDDYEETFSGNTDDMFRIGISVTKKGLKLFADFYSADIIIASPLGLRTVIGAEGDKERDFDFLSSIEILILDQADVFLMQNWEHVLHLFQHLHLQPKESHEVNFSRVRMWCLNGWSKIYRQTIILSNIPHPCLNAVFNKNCFNYSGKVKILNPIKRGTICQIAIQLPQVFHRFTTPTISEIPEIRFKTFCSKILSDYKESTMSHTLIFIPSYFDFVRLRNYFKKETISFVQICEYSKEHKIARARDYFFHNKRHFLLYTERAHFYNRYVIKGIRHLIFYELPTYPHFYSELCNMVKPSNLSSGDISNLSCAVLYTQQNAQQLSAVVGTERARVMLSSDKNVHMFVTSDT